MSNTSVNTKPARIPWFNTKPIGLGDAVSKVTKALGFTECAMCRKRRARLNKLAKIGGKK